MSTIDLAKIQDLIIHTATDVGIKVLGAIALWVIGRWLIGIVHCVWFEAVSSASILIQR